MTFSTPVSLTSIFSLNAKQRTPQSITITLTDTCIALLCAKLFPKCFAYVVHLILKAPYEAGIIMIPILHMMKPNETGLTTCQDPIRQRIGS